MKLLQSAKTELLLEAPIEILHEQSKEWVEQIDFWKDEIPFFFQWISNKTNNFQNDDGFLELDSTQNSMANVSYERLDDLKFEIHNHENMLAKIMKEAGTENQPYRQNHKFIMAKMIEFELTFNEFKKVVFRLSKKNTIH